MIVEILSFFNFNSGTVLLSLVLFFAFFYHRLTKNFDFWTKRKVPGPRPTIFFGNYKDNILGRVHASELTKRLYDEYEGNKYIGIFICDSPVLILRDLELIKDVLVRDFSFFSDRGIHVYETVEPLSQHFFNLPKSSWSPIRKKLSPVFGISSIKRKFNSIVEIADRFIVYLDKVSRVSCEGLECSALMAKFMTEVIGEYGFGLKMDEFHEGQSEFRMISKNRTMSNFLNYARRFLREHCPRIYKYCYYLFYNKRMIGYFVRLVDRVTDYRKREGIHKNDFIGRLMELREDSEEMSENMIAAQAYVFYTAGSDTTAMTISNALYEIAANPLIQKKLRAEILSKLENEKRLTFNNMKNMEYLNLVLKETLRKYALRNITRKTKKSYNFRGTNVILPENLQIIIPQYAIQMDPLIYPQPNVFDPERLVDLQKDFSFGSGPRRCPGDLFAQIVSKIVIVNIVKNFELKTCSARTENDCRKVFLFPKDGIRLKFRNISNA